jgi:superfamily II DNA or RNA helicase
MGIPKHPKTISILHSKLFDGLISFKELEARIASLPTEKERGDAFEVFAEAFLATQAIVGAQQVWPFDALPQGIKKRLGLKGKDQGVDGVFETNTGESVAYQVKYRSARKPITWGEISTFVGLAEKAHNRLVFTNSYIIRDPLIERERLYCYRGYDLDQLEARDFQAIRDYLTETPQPIPQKELRSHQVEAQRRILEALKQADRTILEMACGTGKTLTALRIAESYGAKTLLCLFPSLALIRQTLQEWCKETKWEPGEWIFLCVCSDPTVQIYDDVVLVNSDLNFPVSTDSQTVREFLTLPFDGVRVVFSTYQSSLVVAKGMTEAFELAIFDEAHRTAGREGTNFSFALSDKNLPIKKRLFMTATPRHYRIKEDLEESAVFSMDKPEVYGHVDFRYPFSKAVTEGQICDYRIVISCIGREDLRRHDLEHGETLVGDEVYRSRFAASLLTLSKVIDDNKLKKVIAFTSRVKDAKKVAEKLPSFLPEVEPFFVSGDMQTAQREEEMQAFRECEKGVITNARCLTEGVDVPAVDAVAFLTPKKSKIDIVQAVGRAMRTSPGKGYGFVVLPVQLEFGETEEEAVKKTNFDMVWDVVRFLLEQDSQAEEIFQKIRIEQGSGRPIDFSRLREKVQVLGVNIALEDLEQAIYLRLLERTVSNWWEMYGKLLTYHKIFGNCKVPQGWKEDPKLANWVSMMRQIRKRGRLDAEKVSLLDEIAFEWEVYDREAWHGMYHAIKNYFEQNKTLQNIDAVHQGAMRWWNHHKTQFKRMKLAPEKAKLMDYLVRLIDRTLQDEYWWDKFNEIKKHTQKHGYYFPNDWLWRNSNSIESLSSDKQELLLRELICFPNWYEIQWWEIAQKVRNLILANLKLKGTERQKLMNWIIKQKKRITDKNTPKSWLELPLYRGETLAPDMVDYIKYLLSLQKIIIEADWWSNFRLAKSYYLENSSLNGISVGGPSLKKIYAWLHNQEKHMLKGTLPTDKAKALTSIGIGMISRRKVRRIEVSERLKELEQFYNDNGSSLSGLWKLNPALFKWYHYNKKHLGNFNNSERELILSFSFS